MSYTLVTGATGFIGTHLTKQLLKEGKDVLGFGRDFANNKIFHKSYDFKVHDVRKPFPYYDVNEIYHLACPSSAEYFRKNPREIMDIILNGTMNAVKYAGYTNSRLIVASSLGASCEYLPTFRSCYDVSKKAMESYVHYATEQGLVAKTVRLPSVFGEGMSLTEDRLIPNLMNACIAGKEPPLYGNIANKRAFAHIGNVIHELRTIMKLYRTGIWGIKAQESLSIQNLSEAIQYAFEKPKEYGEFAHVHKSDFFRKIADTLEYFKEKKNVNC